MNIDQSNEVLRHESDELVQEVERLNLNNATVKKTRERVVNLILDHTAFVRGIGNIKRWFNSEYIKANHRIDNNELIYLNIYIPSYTLHEFDFVKKGTSMTATNAREAIRFIDSYFDGDDWEPSKQSESSNPIRYNLIIESPTDFGPSWKECLKFKIYTPLVKDFPNYKTKFDSNLIGQQPILNGDKDQVEEYDTNSNISSALSTKQNNQLNDIQYENSPSYQSAIANSMKPAEMPIRLKYLLKSCIFKRHYENNNPRNFTEEWKLVTEDSITKIWSKSFGIDSLNVNEAELLIFKNYDVNQFRLYNTNNDFSLEDESNLISNDILQNKIDTTKYAYTKMEPFLDNRKLNKNKNKNRKSKNKINGIVSDHATGINGDNVKKERFHAINYAPRGSGELWKP